MPTATKSPLSFGPRGCLKLLTGEKFMRVERVVQGPLPKLVEAALRLRPDRVADAPHGPAQPAKGGAEWAGANRRVFVESQNAFRVKGKVATLAGKPDLVVLDDRDATIIDVKTGREQAWHRVQVMIYQYALPLAVPEYRDLRISGEVVYPDPHGAGSCREQCPTSSSRTWAPSSAGWRRTRRPDGSPAAQSAAFATSGYWTVRSAWRASPQRRAPPTISDPQPVRGPGVRTGIPIDGLRSGGRPWNAPSPRSMRV